MKYSVSNNTKIDKIPVDTEAIHLTRPVKIDTLEKLIKKCRIKEITISKSCFSRLPEKTKKLFKNSGAKIGDLLFLTKPLGTGINLAAHKVGLIDDDAIIEVIDSMKKLNNIPFDLMDKIEIRGGNDITGFGLFGHG